MTKRAKAPESFNGHYNAFPRVVEHSTAVVSLSDAAYRLLHAALDLHRGSNNGHIALTLAKLVGYGWNSNDKLTRATRELLDRRLLCMTKQGGMGIGPSLFALTWLRIHDFTGLDVGPAGYRQGAWMDCQPGAVVAAPTPGAGQIPSYEKSGRTLDRLTVRQHTVPRCETGPSDGVASAPLDRETVRKPPKKMNRPHRQAVTVTELPIAAVSTAPEILGDDRDSDGADSISGMVG